MRKLRRDSELEVETLKFLSNKFSFLKRDIIYSRESDHALTDFVSSIHSNTEIDEEKRNETERKTDGSTSQFSLLL